METSSNGNPDNATVEEGQATTFASQKSSKNFHLVCVDKVSLYYELHSSYARRGGDGWTSS